MLHSSFILTIVRTRIQPFALLLAAPALLALTGCTGPAFPIPTGGPVTGRQLDDIRTDISQIPLPSKTRYLAVKTLTSWENPYLTVQGNMVTLHVTLADANTTDLGTGGMLRPVGARREDLNVRSADLPAALNAVPQSAWPYGRVVAVEEAHDAPQSARPQLRRNMEAAMKSLNDIGVVVYEWQEGGASLR